MCRVGRKHNSIFLLDLLYLRWGHQKVKGDIIKELPCSNGFAIFLPIMITNQPKRA